MKRFVCNWCYLMLVECFTAVLLISDGNIELYINWMQTELKSVFQRSFRGLTFYRGGANLPTSQVNT